MSEDCPVGHWRVHGPGKLRYRISEEEVAFQGKVQVNGRIIQKDDYVIVFDAYGTWAEILVSDAMLAELNAEEKSE